MPPKAAIVAATVLAPTPVDYLVSPTELISKSIFIELSLPFFANFKGETED